VQIQIRILDSPDLLRQLADGSLSLLQAKKRVKKQKYLSLPSLRLVVERVDERSKVGVSKICARQFDLRALSDLRELTIFTYLTLPLAPDHEKISRYPVTDHIMPYRRRAAKENRQP